MAADSIQHLVTRAKKAYDSGRFAEAAALYGQAAAAHAAAGDTVQAAEMTNNHSVALLQAGEAQAALDACLGTDEIFARAGDIRKQALVFGNQAAALEALGRLDEALARYCQSSDLLKQSGDLEARAYVLKSISALQIRTGHQFEGLASMEAALENKKHLSLQERLLKKIIHVPFQMLKRGK